MIIPVSPVPVRIALETQAINNGGYVVHDINVSELIEKADSAQYELQLCYGTTSLYRSSVYHINKYARTITFFFMVGQDLFTATLSVGSTRCTFAKMSSGLTESQVKNLIRNELNTEVAQGVNNIGSNGITITMPTVDNTILAVGHLLLFNEGRAHNSSNVFDTFIIHMPGDQWRFPSSDTGNFYLLPVTTDGVNTGISINSTDAYIFSAYVIWYENPDGCTIELGSYQPPSGD